MSEDDEEYKYEYVNNTSNCKYAIYAVDAPPDEIALMVNVSYMIEQMNFFQIKHLYLKY